MPTKPAWKEPQSALDTFASWQSLFDFDYRETGRTLACVPECRVPLGRCLVAPLWGKKELLH